MREPDSALESLCLFTVYSLPKADDDEMESADIKSKWEMKRMQRLERQPLIKEDIIYIMRRNSRASWDSIAEVLNIWCLQTTARNWVTSREGYKVYTERVDPLLIPPQIKWFWGLATRTGAKTCDELGIDSITFKAYHKNHINKMMGIAFTAFTFGDYAENGGGTIKL
eukprot:15366561-Ditylum_brightwellii.AAC.1